MTIRKNLHKFEVTFNCVNLRESSWRVVEKVGPVTRKDIVDCGVLCSAMEECGALHYQHQTRACTLVKVHCTLYTQCILYILYILYTVHAKVGQWWFEETTQALRCKVLAIKCKQI